MARIFFSDANFSGALALDTNYGYSTSSAQIGGKALISFDASRSNSVYTDSGKVYPLSLALNFIIKS